MLLTTAELVGAPPRSPWDPSFIIMQWYPTVSPLIELLLIARTWLLWKPFPSESRVSFSWALSWSKAQLRISRYRSSKGGCWLKFCESLFSLQDQVRARLYISYLLASCLFPFCPEFSLEVTLVIGQVSSDVLTDPLSGSLPHRHPTLPCLSSFWKVPSTSKPLCPFSSQ